MRLGRIIDLTNAEVRSLDTNGMPDREPSGYSIDSRTVRPDELFFAIRGERYDGHQFVADAIARGAMAAVVSRDFARRLPGSATPAWSLLAVEDPLRAMQSIASAVIRGWSGRVVAITGSMGKTTTKDMTAAVLADAGRVAKTMGNLNNCFGLPLSVLQMESNGARAADFDFAVLEMGMNHKGEIAELVRIAPPDIGVVTNVAPVHLEFFSSVEEIAEAKGELVDGIKTGGVAVLNTDDPLVIRMRKMRRDVTFRSFGFTPPADISACDISEPTLEGTTFSITAPRGKAAVRLRVPGNHNLSNALAAAAVGDVCGLSVDRIGAALSDFSAAKMRGQTVRFKEGFVVIDDSYNSNPRALLDMVRTLCEIPGWARRVLIAGEMLELGKAGADLHREAGRRIGELGVEKLFGVRGLAAEMVTGAREAGMDQLSARFFETPEEAAEAAAVEIIAGDLVLVKGSRGIRTEVIVRKLMDTFEVEGEGDATGTSG